MRSPALARRGGFRAILRAIFPAVLVVLVASQLRAFGRSHRGEEPGQGYYVLRLREPGQRPLRPRFAGFAQLRPAVAGVRVFVPQGVEIDAWSWRNLALADLQPLERAIPVRPRPLRSASVAVVRLPDRNVFLLEPPAKLQRGPAVLLSGGGDLFLAPASQMAERRRR